MVLDEAQSWVFISGIPHIAPGDHRLVGRQLLRLPVEAQVLREALVDTLDIRFPGRPLLTADGEPRVDPREESTVRAGIVEDNWCR